MEDFQQLLIIMVVIWVFGIVFRSLSLPLIFGELIAGILVGPLVLDLINPESDIIKILAELGIFFLMLHSGLETDPNELIKSSRKSIIVALGSALLPFICGFFTSYLFGFSTIESMFIAMGLSITAVVISAKLLKEYKIQKSKVAHIVISAAIVIDILVLILFSVISSINENDHVLISDLLLIIIKIVLFFAIVLFIGFKTSKYLPTMLKRKGFTFTLIVALVLGLIAENIGLHFIIGSFLAGLFIRQEIVDPKVFHKIEDRIYGLSYSFLGPIFFASLALNFNFDAAKKFPLFLIIIIIVAILGKFIGSGLVAWVQGVKKCKAILIGCIMNSRGTVELIIASIGYQSGIITKDILSILITMSFVTTFISVIAMKPIMKCTYKRE